MKDFSLQIYTALLKICRAQRHGLKRDYYCINKFSVLVVDCQHMVQTAPLTMAFWGTILIKEESPLLHTKKINIFIDTDKSERY